MASAVLASRNETNWSTTTSTSAAHHQQQQSSQRSFSNNNNNNNKNNYMGKFPPFGNPNPNQNNFNNHHHQHNLNNSRKQFSHQLLNGAVEELIPGDAASFNRNNRRDSDVGVAGVPFSRYVSFDISAYSKSDLRKLKSQLMSELDKVRILSCRIDTGDVVNRSVSKKRSSPFPPTNGNTNKEPKRSAPNGRQQQQQQQPPQQPQPPPYVASAQVMKSCGTVLKKLSTQKSSIWFNTPVDVVGMGLHDYHTVINRPMDLGTIKDKLDRRVYDSPEDFAADVRLTFNNALRYNPKGHEVNTIAGQYLALFEKWFPPILAKYQSEKQLHFQQMVPRKNPISNPPVPKPVKEDFSVVDDEVQGSSWSKFPSPDPPKMFNPVKRPDPKPVTPPPPPPPPVCAPVPVPVPVAEPMPVQMPIPVPMPMRTPTPRREPSPVVAPAVDKSSGGGSGRGRKSEGKLPKPKAKDPNKRGMTMEEKHKLGAGLQSLPEEKMSQVIQIIRKRNGDLTQDGDEIELDIEAVDTETLWELDRFVTNYKKMVSKIQRQALLPVRNNAGGFSDDTNQAGMSDRMMMDTPSKPKKGGVVGGGGGGDGDVAEEDVDIGDEMPVNNFPPLEIDKDDDRQQGGDHSDSSSSSGSSSDDSSSSDSDSGSSSGSDSDVDDAQSRDNGSKNFHH